MTIILQVEPEWIDMFNVMWLLPTIHCRNYGVEAAILSTIFLSEIRSLLPPRFSCMERISPTACKDQTAINVRGFYCSLKFLVINPRIHIFFFLAVFGLS